VIVDVILERVEMFEVSRSTSVTVIIAPMPSRNAVPMPGAVITAYTELRPGRGETVGQNVTR
jgi:hypothetical protein